MNNDQEVVYFGETDARNRRLRFGIKKIDRSRHLYAIGKTGMGKSTLLENLAVQDIQNGEGLCFLDPHGKSADLLLEYVPEHRIKDVVYFAPFDMEHPISFNVMEDVGPQQRYLVASGMMSAFKKIWVDAWSARMEYILGNIMLALLEYPGSTLVAVNRMLTDKDFRKEVVDHITDPSVKSFWVNEYANYTDKFAAEAAPAIQNKVGQFVANPLIRNIIGQAKSSFDIREIMDNKKILIINLSKGRVGEANANLLGSMLITKIYLAAMSRADLKEKELAAAPNFNLYVDEFQSFANESFADILSEARKYKLSLCIAHQYIEQMTEEVRAAVFGNVGTMCVFRVGAYDAEVLEKEFAPQFTAEDIVNLQKYQMYLKLMIDGVTSPPFSASGMAPIPRPEISYMTEIIDASRAQYAKPRQQVEDELLAWINTQFGKGGGSAPSAFGNSSPARAKSDSYGGQQGGQGGQGRSGDRQGGDRPSGDRQGDRQGSGQRSSPGSYQNQGQSGGSNQPPRQAHSSGSAPGAPRDSQGPRNAGQGQSQSPSGTPQSQSQPPRAPYAAPSSSASRAPQNSSQQPSDRGQGRPEFGQNTRNADGRGPQPFARESSRRDDRGGSRPGGMGSNDQQSVKDMNAHETKFRNAISLGYLKAEQEPKNDQKTPKAENLNALRDALLSVMGSTGMMPEGGESEKRESGTQAALAGNDAGSLREQPEGQAHDERGAGTRGRAEDNQGGEPRTESFHGKDPGRTRRDDGHGRQPETAHKHDAPRNPEPEEKGVGEISEAELKKLLG